jgi:hypothetical protein
VYDVATDEDGNFYVGDQFKVEQATGKATLDSSAFDLTGLESLQLGSIGGLIGASVNEFSTDGTMAQNSNNKVPTQAAVRTYVSSLNSVSGNFTVGGNLTVNGTTTTIDSATLSVEDANIGIGSVTTPTNSTANGGGLTLFGGADGDKEFKWIDSGTGPDYWSLSGGLLYSQSGINLAGLLKEKVAISADKLSVNTQIDVGTSQVHYRTTAETTTSTPNIRYSAGMSLNDAMNIGEALTVTIITTAAAAGYSADITIDGNNLSENWIGGSAPSQGSSSGLDIYTYNIIKTANATFTVIANVSNAA